MSEESPSVAAVVLTWNEYDDTAASLDSILAQSLGGLEVVLVDNGSTDDSIDRLEDEFPTVSVVRNETNLGFAAGINRGIQYALDAGTDYVCVMNNDIIVPEGVLEGLVDSLEGHPDWGIISPYITQYPNTDSAWFTQGVIEWRAGAVRHGETVLDPRRQDGRWIFNDYVPLTCAVVRREVFDQIGLLADPYFIYREDADFGARAVDAGFKVVTDTDLVIHHRENRTTGGPLTPFFTYYMARNRWLFRHRFADRIRSPPFLLECLRWMGKVTVRSTMAGRADTIAAMLRGTWDGVRNRGGSGPY